uniref:Growth differentiation factor 7 n=1 Tax=Anser brachyrhynchus TaxID=132585 RepID=A0A8B9BBB6_9AVES
GVGRGLVLGAAGDRAGSGGRCSGGREGSAPRAAAQNETRCTLERDLLIWPRRVTLLGHTAVSLPAGMLSVPSPLFAPRASAARAWLQLAGFLYSFSFFFFFFFVCVFLSLPDASLSTPEQRYLFDISSLPEAEEVTGAELRVLRALPENRSLALSPEGTFHHLLLSTCPSRDGEEPRLLDSRAADVLDAGSSRWEVFDVWEALRGRRERSPSGKLLCFLLRIVSDQSGRLLPPRQLGFSKPRPQPHERALLVAFSHTQRKENLFKEIRDKIKALGIRGVPLRGGVRLPPALPPGAHQPRHHPDPDELHGPGVHPPELLRALQAQPHQRREAERGQR